MLTDPFHAARGGEEALDCPSPATAFQKGRRDETFQVKP